MSLRPFGDPSEIRTPDTLIKSSDLLKKQSGLNLSKRRHLGTTIAQGAATAWRRSDDGSVKRDPEEGRTPIGSARPARFTGGDGPPL